MALKTSTTWLAAAAFGVAAVGGGLLASAASPTPAPAVTSPAVSPTPDMEPIIVVAPTVSASPDADPSTPQPTPAPTATETIVITGTDQCDDLDNDYTCDDEQGLSSTVDSSPTPAPGMA
ncbi:hypothetical protein C3E87_12435, partial [Tessaracoccus sp. ZS01]